MFRYHIRLSIRNFQKHKSTFCINLFGMAIGLTTVLLITSWVKNEWTVIGDHEQIDRIYQVMTNHDNASGITTIPVTPGQMAEAMSAEYPQIELASGASPHITGMSFATGDSKSKADGFFVDQEFLEIFSISFLAGNPKTALEDLNSVVISETLATHLFGSPNNAIGKSLKWQVFNFTNEVEVKGVFRDVTKDKFLDKTDYLLNFKFFQNMLGEGMHWDNFNAGTFLLLHEGTDISSFNESISGFIKDKKSESNVTAFVQKYADTYLYNTYEEGKVAGGRISYIWIFSAIALFILLIACINFMNLSTARAMSRVKEIGVKKTMGANRIGLFNQFMTESFLLVFFALVLAVLGAYLLKPFFNELTSINLGFYFGLYEIVLLLGVWILTGVLAGIYPAIYLSKFRPMEVLRSNLKGSFGELLARKGLVVFQFGISLLLIIGILVISRQMSFIQNQNLGYNQSQLLQISSTDFETDQVRIFLEEAKQIPGVENASSLSHPLVGLSSSTIGLTWEGKSEAEQVKFENVTVNMGLIETMGFELLVGRTFSPEFGEEQSKIILNETAVKTIGFDDPLGQIVNLWGKDMEVIGVIRDFNFESLREKVKPTFLKYDPKFAHKIMVRISPENQDRTIAELSDLYQNQSGKAIDYTFMDEDFQTLYESEKRISSLAKYFGVIAIFLSCLGLFGLAAFTAEKRKKEIGVRKVLGASVTGILAMVSKDFLQLILIAIILTVPLGYYLADSWLDDYAYQSELTWWIFAGSGILLIVIAMLTVGYQAYKAASSNPVKSLQND